MYITVFHPNVSNPPPHMIHMVSVCYKCKALGYALKAVYLDKLYVLFHVSVVQKIFCIVSVYWYVCSAANVACIKLWSSGDLHQFEYTFEYIKKNYEQYLEQ